jgi:hypothetical protein
MIQGAGGAVQTAALAALVGMWVHRERASTSSRTGRRRRRPGRGSARRSGEPADGGEPIVDVDPGQLLQLAVVLSVDGDHDHQSLNFQAAEVIPEELRPPPNCSHKAFSDASLVSRRQLTRGRRVRPRVCAVREAVSTR